MTKSEYMDRATDAYAHGEISKEVLDVLCKYAKIFCDVEEEEIEGPCGEVCNDL